MADFYKSILSLTGLLLLIICVILGCIGISYQRTNQTTTDIHIYDSTFLSSPYCEMCNCRCEKTEHIALTCTRKEVPTEHEYIYTCPQCGKVYQVKFSR